MVSIDRYTYQPSILAGNQRRQQGAPGGESDYQPPVPAPPPVVSGGTETGTSTTSKLSGMLFAIGSGDDKGVASGKATADEFLSLSKMTLAQRIRKDILDKHKMSEADLASLPPEERKAIEDEIKEAIKQAYGLDDTQGLKPGADTAAGAAGPGEADKASTSND